MCVRIQFSVGANIKQPARGVIRTRRKRIAIREKPETDWSCDGGKKGSAVDLLDRVDVRLVTSERLGSLAAADIPELRGRVTGTRNENVLIWSQRETWYIDQYGRFAKTKREQSAYLITSPVWSLNSTTRTPASMSQSMQVMSPELVTI